MRVQETSRGRGPPTGPPAHRRGTAAQKGVDAAEIRLRSSHAELELDRTKIAMLGEHPKYVISGSRKLRACVWTIRDASTRAMLL